MTDSTQERDSRGPRSDGDARGPRGDGDSRGLRSDGDSRGSGSRFGGPQAQRSEGDGPPRRQGGGRRPSGGRYSPRRKVSQFAIDNVQHVDYKDLARLRRHVGERGKIEPRRKMGASAKHQRSLTVAIKRARYMALLPFTSSTERH